MTRKDYELIARAVRSAGWPIEEQGRAVVAGLLADELEADNPRFIRARFIRACMGEDNEHG